MRLPALSGRWWRELKVSPCTLSSQLGHAFADVNSYRPGKVTLILAGIACGLTLLGIALNYFARRQVEFSHCVLALGLLAFVVWFSGRRDEEE